LRVADAMDTGLVWINIVLGDAADLPFGCVKRSGSGREMGRYAMETFVNKKLARIAWFLVATIVYRAPRV